VGLTCPSCGNQKKFLVKTLQMHVVQLDEAHVEISEETRPAVFEVLCDEPTQALGLLREWPEIIDATIFGEALHLLARKGTDEEGIIGFLKPAGGGRLECRRVLPSLEDVFVTLTRRHRS